MRHRDVTRWNRLRASSWVFAANETWVVALSRYLEEFAPWLLSDCSKALPAPRRIPLWCIQAIVGRPSQLATAVRILNTVQPWALAELISLHMVLSLVAATLFSRLMISSYSVGSVLFFWIVPWFVTFRYLRHGFIHQAALRQRSIKRFLPHAMDTFTMVINAGGTFDAGLHALIQDFPSHPLSEELAQLRSKTERGLPRSEAIKDTAETICLPEFHEVALLLTRAQQHGAPAAESFAKIARQMRVNHLRDLEEAVGRAQVAIGAPAGLVMIACLLVAIAPFVLSIANSFLLD
jgi:pilus assembly protein TadC